eukprot:769149-Rhodomonas_salina.1
MSASSFSLSGKQHLPLPCRPIRSSRGFRWSIGRRGISSGFRGELRGVLRACARCPRTCSRLRTRHSSSSATLRQRTTAASPTPPPLLLMNAPLHLRRPIVTTSSKLSGPIPVLKYSY